MEMPCRRFVSASQDGTARVWDANTRRCVFTLSGHTRPVTCVKWGGDGFIHTSSRDGNIMVWDAKVMVLFSGVGGRGWVGGRAWAVTALLPRGCGMPKQWGMAQPWIRSRVCHYSALVPLDLQGSAVEFIFY